MAENTNCKMGFIYTLESSLTTKFEVLKCDCENSPTMNPGGNLTKLFFFVNKKFFHFSLLSLTIAMNAYFSLSYKNSSLTAKIGKPEK